MSNIAEQPFNEFEERYFLAEILKNSGISPLVLLKLIADLNIDPGWYQIALPHGRSVVACQHAFEALLSRLPTGADPKLKKNKRPLSMSMEEAVSGFAGNERSIQPRPSAFAPVNLQGQSSPVQGGERQGKKRGRPSKLEHEQRVREAEARGEVYPPPKKIRTPRPSIEGAAVPTGGGLPVGGTAPKAVMFTPNRTGPPDVSSSTSSRKKKRPERAPADAAGDAMEQLQREAAQPQDETGHFQSGPGQQEGPQEGQQEVHQEGQQVGEEARRPPPSTIPETQMSGFEARSSLVAETPQNVDEPEVRDTPMGETGTTESTATVRASYHSGNGHSIAGPHYSGQQI